MRSDGRGRPRLEQSRRPVNTAREEILDAAAELFTSLGYASTSTRRIADAVGVRPASLYHHFATKDDILDALLDRHRRRAVAVGRRAPRREGSGSARLHALVVSDVTSCAQPVEPRRAVPASWLRSIGSTVPASPRRTAAAIAACGPGHRGLRRPRRRRRPAVSAGRVVDQPPLR